LWEVATGREAVLLPCPAGVLGQGFSPDGRMLACVDSQGEITLWELASGQDRCRLVTDRRDVNQTEFSPDGRWLAQGHAEGTIAWWDVLRGEKACTLAGHEGPVASLAFTPDGRRLVTASSDTTLLVWDAAAATARRAKSPTPDAAAVLAAWNDLASDAKSAWRAARVLLDAPEQSAALIGQRVRPAEKFVPQRVRRWLAELDSDDFAERDRATRGLARLGGQAEGAVRAFLDRAPSAEAKRRAEDILAGLRGPVTDPERLRSLRAVEVLEHVGSAAAERVLRTLAEGHPEDRLTREADATLRRLVRRSRR
jgi:hypothetical protein